MTSFGLKLTLRRCTYVGRLVKSRRSSSLSVFDGSFHRTRNCVRTVMDAYKAREMLPDQQPSHPLVLTVRPDQFDKLPPKCSSCGVILQSTHEKELGFIQRRKFLETVEEQKLDTLVCVNCFKLRHYNQRLAAPLSNRQVRDHLSHIRRTNSLVLYVVDMFDIEASVMERVLSYVSRSKRIILVGNKIDRVPLELKVKGNVQMERMKDVLKEICARKGLIDCNLKDICLVSAKTGFGLETLLEKIRKHRDVHMDVYLVGCANVGKSTLYNLLQNMLNVHKKEALPAQAIVHWTPGTTVSLIRASISRRRLERMQRRLKDGPWEEDHEYTFDDELLDLLNVKEKNRPRHDKRSFADSTLLLNAGKDLEVKELEIVDFDEMKKEKKDCFLYDTPGIINETQILQYLTPDEIHMLCPTEWIVPRTILMRPGNCLFIGALARLDYNDISRCETDVLLATAAKSIFVTVMVSPRVPCHVTSISSAGEKYLRLFTRNILHVPIGSPSRFAEYPDLVPRDYTITGKSLNTNACDLVLHGVGWLSVASVTNTLVQVSLHTPNAIGQELRLNPLLPYSVRTKEGKSKMYRGQFDGRMYSHTRAKNPQFVRVFHPQNEAVYAWHKHVKGKLSADRQRLREERRLKRVSDGVVLGKWKALKEKEDELRRIDTENLKRLLLTP